MGVRQFYISDRYCSYVIPRLQYAQFTSVNFKDSLINIPKLLSFCPYLLDYALKKILSALCVYDPFPGATFLTALRFSRSV